MHDVHVLYYHRWCNLNTTGFNVCNKLVFIITSIVISLFIFICNNLQLSTIFMVILQYYNRFYVMCITKENAIMTFRTCSIAVRFEIRDGYVEDVGA